MLNKQGESNKPWPRHTFFHMIEPDPKYVSQKIIRVILTYAFVCLD